MSETINTPSIAAIIKAARKRKGMTQKALAAACDCTLAHIGRIEVGMAQPSLNLLAVLQKELDTLIFDLFPIFKEQDKQAYFNDLLHHLPNHPSNSKHYAIWPYLAKESANFLCSPKFQTSKCQSHSIKRFCATDTGLGSDLLRSRLECAIFQSSLSINSQVNLDTLAQQNMMTRVSCCTTFKLFAVCA